MQSGWEGESPATTAPSSRVRVTYFESRRPLSVSGSEDGSCDVIAGSGDVTGRVTARTVDMPTTQVISSVDAGWENPFRPGGELSREADQIVRAIQSGRPLQEADRPDGVANGTVHTNGSVATPPEINGATVTAVPAVPLQAAPPSAAPTAPSIEGSTVLAVQQPGTVEVHHSLVTLEQPGQVERVAIKRKSRARCCVIQ